MIDLLPLLDWTSFIYFAIPAMLLLAVAAFMAFRDKRAWALVFSLLAIAVLSVFIGGMWHSLQRPPLRTMGETRLWYSFFVIIAGVIVYIRWHYKWILSFSAVMASVFMIINLAKPEIHNKSMMPALESPFFVPHVISYIFSYALLGAALLTGLYIIYRMRRDPRFDAGKLIGVTDNLVYTGLAFLMIGLLLGAVWAKQAWGTYWGWDPKETWAAITLMSYLLYVHHRLYRPRAFAHSLILLLTSFLFLQMCWYGVNYLPSAQGVSVHTYGS
ncbi:cytochrome c biogenesis protein [Porphyromonas pogonae]|uniref:cytochrome c biogenesis protein n=1 Tax=Porphyromonas pogonae TaxID=867595 RepID=UPI002E77911C|nr:cytochrome c biogenesis protein CcsA [Porphyromonas pogonae]